jgi:riboflavin-specific deaminase-like protein
LNGDLAWRLLRALALAASRGEPASDGDGVGLDEHGALVLLPAGRGLLTLRSEHAHGFETSLLVSESARALLELHLPLCVGERSQSLVVAHLGQSLDGRVATVTGASRFITGPEDLRHMHRLRALFDAVVVGARTACLDDPQLTTRLVPGRNPARVVLDPHARLGSHLQLLRDGSAPTLLLRAEGAGGELATAHVAQAELEHAGGTFAPKTVLATLRARGLRRIFVEGGGITVSRFLQAGALDRLQLAVAPKIIGSGAPALSLRPIEELADALEVRSRRFALGPDVLFDCDLRAGLA